MIQFSSQDTYLNGTIAQVHHLLEITSCEGRRSIWFMQQRMVQGRSWRVFERIASRSSSAFNINRCVHKFGGLFSVKFVGIIDVIICIYFAPFPLNIYIPGSGKLLKRKWRQQHMCRVLIKVYIATIQLGSTPVTNQSPLPSLLSGAVRPAEWRWRSGPGGMVELFTLI